MSPEEEAQLEIPFIGRDGTTRKLEVEYSISFEVGRLTIFVVYPRKAEAKEDFSIRSKMERLRSQIQHLGSSGGPHFQGLHESGATL